MDIMSMFGSMPGHPQAVPHSTGASLPAYSMAPTSAPGGSTTMTMTTNTPTNHLPAGLVLGGGADKASIAAFMVENNLNKLNTLASASGLVPNSTQNLHERVLSSSVLDSVRFVERAYEFYFI